MLVHVCVYAWVTSEIIITLNEVSVKSGENQLIPKVLKI